MLLGTHWTKLRFSDSRSNGEKATKPYNIGEWEQWCLTTLGYLKAISRQYVTEVSISFGCLNFDWELSN